MSVDLHCHSTASDGMLSPEAVVQRALSRGVSLLALTDHDTLLGLPAARAEAQKLGLDFLSGVEISTRWQKTSIHVVGLNFSPGDPHLIEQLSGIRQARKSRALRIAEKLANAGIPHAWEGVVALASPQSVGRPHFARYLVSAGYAKNVRDAFEQYLIPGRPGYESLPCATIAQAVEWIHGAQGFAILAHPGRYSPHLIDELLQDFHQAHGDAVEVAHSSHTPEQVIFFAKKAREYGFMASRGSDFHQVGEGGELGRVAPLPVDLTPVWTKFKPISWN